MTNEMNSEATPESLMENFKGPKFVSLAILTVVVHVVIILGTSFPFLVGKLGGSSKLSKEERIKLAVEEATIEIRKIAEDYELNPQEISDQFAGKSRASRAAEENPNAPEEPVEKPDDASGEPPEKSAIELKIEEKKEGPKVPTFEDKKDDIF